MEPGQRHVGLRRYLLAPLTGNENGSMELMVSRVRHIVIRLLANVLFNPVNDAPLHSLPSV